MARASISNSDVKLFVNACAFARAMYVHYRWMFAPHFEIADVPKDILKTTAPVLYGDLNRASVEYMIISMCRLTDRGAKNLAVPFFATHCSFPDRTVSVRFKSLAEKIMNFRRLVQPARDKFGAHLDRQAHAKGSALGAASFDLWDRFWLDLQAFVEILSKHFLGTPVLICAADGSDAPTLLQTVHDGRLTAHAEEIRRPAARRTRQRRPLARCRQGRAARHRKIHRGTEHPACRIVSRLFGRPRRRPFNSHPGASWDPFIRCLCGWIVGPDLRRRAVFLSLRAQQIDLEMHLARRGQGSGLRLSLHSAPSKSISKCTLRAVRQMPPLNRHFVRLYGAADSGRRMEAESGEGKRRVRSVSRTGVAGGAAAVRWRPVNV